MAANRGFDVKTSKSRDLLIQAADRLLWEQGGQAISARRVAEQAGLKPQLVHYYFRSMEDLMIALFHHATETYAERHDAALATDYPLHAIWELNHGDRSSTKRNIEFVALGNTHEKLRKEMLAAGERFRALQIGAVEQALERSPATTHSAAGLAMMMAAVARTIVMEDRLGISLGHVELRAMMEGILDEIEPPRANAKI